MENCHRRWWGVSIKAFSATTSKSLKKTIRNWFREVEKNFSFPFNYSSAEDHHLPISTFNVAKWSEKSSSVASNAVGGDCQMRLWEFPQIFDCRRKLFWQKPRVMCDKLKSFIINSYATWTWVLKFWDDSRSSKTFWKFLIDLCYQVKNLHSRQDEGKSFRRRVTSSICKHPAMLYNDARYNLNSSTHDNKFDDALSTLIADSFSAKLTRASDKLNLMRFRLGKLAMVENDGKSAEHNLCAR